MRRLGVPQSYSGDSGKKKNFLALSEFKPQTVQPIA
jgi:hypothetical protein